MLAQNRRERAQELVQALARFDVAKQGRYPAVADAVDGERKRYQIKHRNAHVLNVDKQLQFLIMSGAHTATRSR